MDNLKGYRDLIQEIELWELRLADLKRERKYLIKRMNVPPSANLCASYTGLPGGGMMVINLPKYWARVQEIDERIEECMYVLRLKRKSKRDMERLVEKIDQLEYRVAFMRDVECKKLHVIAKELNLSESRIRKVSMTVPRVGVKIPS